ncbi:4'-phosphopantetheinyl transferase Sfp [Clostridium pasteurianum DSM 525 = ATCC 6013]|uniref:4'-phosphopantetheinyl transferase Sfp n=1 Tax=Clostridium pasteurianum DSM 525 = ATCC 6013 TaxID=1262449 RepID=A0A0H3J702_CLOPA|nr:4'-phosphopantetheinyl transferase superfamily protein [Clostridium pasteurianum]AJA48997.1 4'-phosphopantetheinyl transferase Sfp [Clostridium pasteurianum DSM 525 = ATCC 6013]AJA52985.1 4'-phosphopantetheinyl transferase Sfp [Clostridium pasteurianum DSM 525 = ATCC 6013]AOZ76204.1 4-phosphopantetheinyl transferase [Clostridium pasteurianum DSM 525 = ATCC 6013]AOZ80000.1 4-phosphopantetheinyl transferase [Clostridium pasteurianum]ELP60293.1 4'-phosphopantetheinyl transferase [Clostridium p
MFEIYAVNIRDFKDEKILDEFFKYISAEKIQRLLRFRISEDKKRGMVSDLLVRYLICNKLKIKNHEINFTVNKFGKPFLKDYIGLEYNISHSNELVVCAIGNYGVGIDIEYIKDIDLNTANYVFSTEEYEEYNNVSLNKKLDYFYSIWTLKESLIKAKGMGLHIPMNSFTLTRNSNKELYCLYNNSKYYFKEYSIPEYKLSICSKMKAFPKDIQFYSSSEFLSFFEPALKKQLL